MKDPRLHQPYYLSALEQGNESGREANQDSAQMLKGLIEEHIQQEARCVIFEQFRSVNIRHHNNLIEGMKGT